jgi:hypothetical protein
MEREMRELCARLYAMETTQSWTPNTRDINDDESENKEGEEKFVAEDAA